MFKAIFKQSAVYFIMICLLISILSIRLQKPPIVNNIPPSDTSFSVQRAYNQLNEITWAPHSIGTSAHDSVMQSIVQACKAAGLITKIQQTTAVKTSGATVKAADVKNIIAIKKGVNSSKAVLVMAHYDSHPNSFGAGDDGAAVVSMLETMRVLNASATLKNDIIFLFTDGEEYGMFGAKAFLDESDLASQVGLVINFEGRGNSGIATMFEVNARNGWVVKEYIKGAAWPYANSLSYEIYKKLPNNTDYSLFKKAGIAGLNNAYIEGFVNYHSMTDTRERLDQGSLRHTGENMVSLVKHFGNIDIKETKANDISYFNVAGAAMVHFPVSWNVLGVVLVFALLTLHLIMGIRSKRIVWKGVIAGILAFPLTVAVLYFITGLLVKGTISLIPFNDRFYQGAAYNSGYYFFSITAFAIALFALVYGLIIKRVDILSVLTGTMLVQSLLLLALLWMAPGACYFLCIPLLVLVTGRIVIDFANINLFTTWKYPALQTIFSLPALLIMPPVIYLTFTAFGLSAQLPLAIVMLCLLMALLLPLLAPVIKLNAWLFPALGAACFLAAMVWAYSKAGYTNDQPLPTNVSYVLQPDSGKAVWVSDFIKTDNWNRQFFTHPLIQPVPGRYGPKLVNEAPVLPLQSTEVVVRRDTIENGKRMLRLYFSPAKDIVCLQVGVPNENPFQSISIDGKDGALDNASFYRLEYYNPGLHEIEAEFSMDPAVKFKMIVIDRRIGIPEFKKYKPMPAGMVHSASSNSMDVLKSYEL